MFAVKGVSLNWLSGFDYTNLAHTLFKIDTRKYYYIEKSSPIQMEKAGNLLRRDGAGISEFGIGSI